MAPAPRESQVMQGWLQVRIHPHSLTGAGLQLNEAFCLSLPAWETRAPLNCLTGMCLLWKFLKPVTKWIFVFLFTPFVSTGRLQLDREQFTLQTHWTPHFHHLPNSCFLLISKSSALLKNTAWNLTYKPFSTVIILKKKIKGINWSDEHSENHCGFLQQMLLPVG